MMLNKFYCDEPLLPWQRNLGQNRLYNSTCVRDITEIFAYIRGFSGLGYWMTPDKFYHDEPPLPWQRNLGQNRLQFGLYKRYLWELCVYGGYRCRAIEWCQSNFITTDPGCHGNEIWDKTSYNSARIENITVPLAPSRGIRGWAIEWCHTNSTTTNPVAMAMKFNPFTAKYLSGIC